MLYTSKESLEHVEFRHFYVVGAQKAPPVGIGLMQSNFKA